MVQARRFAFFAAALAEKFLQQRGAFLSHDPALQFGLVVELGLGKQVDHRACSARFGVQRAKHHTLEPGMQHGAAAHGAGLQRDIQLAIIEPVIAQRTGGGAQRHDLGMCRRVMPVHRRIAARGNHFTPPNHNSADRNLPCRGCRTGFCKRQFHELV
ncbi:hypothetical protein D9M73_102740 [compost metagenome]